MILMVGYPPTIHLSKQIHPLVHQMATGREGDG
jgi:hypothetical protein